jgi:tRNA A-37 threonylcarbamoyl transferase component Bud32
MERVAGLADPATNAPESISPSVITAQHSIGARPAPPRPLVEIPGYHVLGLLGQGGMGLVYKARDLRLDRVVALKTIRSGDHASARELARFRTEAQAAARLQHPNIVQIYEVGEANEQPFISMEYVEGKSLAGLMNGTPWPGLSAARLVGTLARAMDAAHRQEIVHRDLKPANILIEKDEVGRMKDEQSKTNSDSSFILHPSSFIPKITDFGLAKMMASNQGQTESGAFLGTPSYAAPEQAGAHRSAIGPHTDIYALGAILYELLTGRPPFKGTTLMETIRQVIDQEPVPPRMLNPSVSGDLEAVCLKCLEKTPARRYQSAADLAEDLRRWQDHEPIQARSPGALGRAARWCRRHPAWTTIAAVIALGILGMSWQWREAVAARKRAEEQREAAVKAEREADKARQDAVEEAAAAREVANFLGGLFEEADPFVLTDRLFGDQPNTNPTAPDVVNRGARQLARPEKELRQGLRVIENRTGKQHFLYTALSWELAMLYSNAGRYDDAAKAFLALEGVFEKSIGDGPKYAQLRYEIARSLARSSLARARQAGDLAESRKQAARVEQYARTAHREAKRTAAGEDQIGISAVYLAYTLLYLRPEPDYAAAEEIA